MRQLTLNKLLKNIKYFPGKLRFKNSFIKNKTNALNSSSLALSNLMQLPNRSNFIDKINFVIDNSVRNPASAAVLLVDVDNFADLNNAYGYKFGDNLLKNIQEILTISFRRGEIFCHYEGSCFAIFVPDIKDTENSITLAKRIMRIFQAPWKLGNHEYYSTVSIGISVFPYDSENIETLIKNAEAALNVAKKTGNSSYQLYSKTIDQEISQRLSIEFNLRKAVEKEEFKVYYQPQVDIATGSIASLEALIRWNHPTEGIIPPSVFIPIAEKSGLINAIGEWVLKTACNEVKEINNLMQHNLSVSVNLSPCQLQDINLSENIFKIIEDTNFRPDLLEIEITEESAIKDITTTINLLNDLKSRNIKIALDDFCTGYSSLCYLELLPVNKIKIDKSFVQGMNENYKKESIVESLISLSHKLGYTIVAEGVEEYLQYESLRLKNCDLIQGYYFSKPLPYEDLIQYISRQV